MMIEPNVLYVDPSALTYIITSVAAVAAAVGAVVVIQWRKAKKKVVKTFNLEDNSIKEVEDEVRLIDIDD